MTVGVINPPASSSAKDRSEAILAQLDRLPTLSSSLARLLAVTQDEQSSTRDLIAVIEPDPALTASILRMVRRPDVGAPRGEMTVAKAVGLLGFTTVRNAAIAHQLFGLFTDPKAESAAMARRSELWRHCIMVACAAEQLATATKSGPSAGEAFVAGLLHDIGKIALDVCFPKSFARVMDRAEHEFVCSCDLENDVFGLDHTVAGKRLAANWQLGGPIVDAVWLHHQEPDLLPATAPHAALIKLVHLADGLVRGESLGFSGSRHTFDADATCRAMGVDREIVRRIVSDLPKRAAPLCEAIGLDSAQTQAARIEALTRANAELSRINGRLTEENRTLAVRGNTHTALTELLALAHGDKTLSTTCASIARALAQAATCEAVVVLAIDDSGSHAHVGAFGGDGMHAEVVENGERFGFQELAGAGTWGSANAELRELFERCTGVSTGGALRSLDLGGGAMCALRFDPRVAVVDQMGDLIRALGATLTAARSRRTAERMTQELLDLNRRLASAQQELARQRSLAMIASMAGGAAHELNNPLAVISGRAQLEQSRCADDELRKVWATIAEQAHRASDIVSELMDFAKPRAPVKTDVVVIDAAKTACQRCGERFGVDAAQIRLDFSDASVSAHCDPEQFVLMLEALIANALQATDGKPSSVEVNSRSTTSDETVRLRVVDRGVGMTPEVLEHALDPFFSHRPAGRGRGLGLSRAYRLAEINGGRLCIESKPNQGTTVSVELPARA